MAFTPIRLDDAKAFGLLVKQWAKYPDTRPQTLEAFKEVTKGIVTLPDSITQHPRYYDWTPENLVLRIPAIEMIEESERILDQNSGNYPLEPFYEQLVDGTMKGREGLYRRIADYTRSRCG